MSERHSRRARTPFLPAAILKMYFEKTNMMTPFNVLSRRPSGKRFRLFFAALFAGALATHAAIPSVEKLLPDDTLIMVTAPDFGKLREIYKTSPQTQLWNDPAMKPFKDKFLSKLKEEFVQPLERELGVRLDDYLNLPQGQLTFAVTQNGWLAGNEQPPGLLLLLDARDKSDQLKTNLATLRKNWVAANKRIQMQKIRDIEFSILPLSGDDVPKTLKKFFPQPDESNDQADEGETKKAAAKNVLVFGQFESLLIVGNSTKAVEKIAIRLTGGATPVLGDLAAYEANRLALFRDAPLYGWVNAKAFVDLLIQSQKQSGNDQAEGADPFPVFSPARIVTAVGLGGVKTVAFNFQNSNEGSSCQFFVGVPEASRQGLFKILGTEAKESGPPAFVPADVMKFQRWRIDGQKAWATLEKVAGDISPQALNSLNFLLDTANTNAMEQNPGFDVRKNLIGNLGDDMISYEKAPRGDTLAELSSPPSLFLLGSPHPEQLAAALKSILVFLGQQAGTPSERDFLGRKIYSVPFPPMMGGKTLNYTASGGYVALTTDTSMLEEFLRSTDSQQKKLRETPGLTEAAQRVGGSSGTLFGYENQAETTRAALEILRKTFGTVTNTNLAPGVPAFVVPSAASAFKEWVDFSLLPPFDKIAKYFSFTVYSGSANVDGLTFRAFAPAPPQLRK